MADRRRARERKERKKKKKRMKERKSPGIEVPRCRISRSTEETVYLLHRLSTNLCRCRLWALFVQSIDHQAHPRRDRQLNSLGQMRTSPTVGFCASIALAGVARLGSWRSSGQTFDVATRSVTVLNPAHGAARNPASSSDEAEHPHVSFRWRDTGASPLQFTVIQVKGRRDDGHVHSRDQVVGWRPSEVA